MKDALTTRLGLKAASRFNTLKIKWTKDAYGSNWTKATEVGFNDKAQLD